MYFHISVFLEIVQKGYSNVDSTPRSDSELQL